MFMSKKIFRMNIVLSYVLFRQMETNQLDRPIERIFPCFTAFFNAL